MFSLLFRNNEHSTPHCCEDNTNTNMAEKVSQLQHTLLTSELYELN